MEYAVLAAMWVATLVSLVASAIPVAVILMVACFVYSGFVERRKRRSH